MLISSFFILFLITNVNAGNITKVDFSIKNPQVYTLGEGDAISFLLNEKETIVAVDDIGKNGARIKGTGSMNGNNEVFYALLNKQIFARLDFNEDGIIDMEVKYLGIKDGKTTLSFQRYFPGDITPEIIGVGNDYTIEKNNAFYRNGFIISALIVAFGLIALFYFRRK